MRFWIDRGGTFTDCIAVDDARGTVRLLKRLSSDQAPLACIREALNLGEDAPIPPVEVRMGTTVATNALLERKGRRPTLVTSRGLGDVLEIGTQARPSVFGLHIVKPELLYARVLEVEARVGPGGERLGAFDEPAIEAALGEERTRGQTALAILLIHSTRFPEDERRIKAIAERLGFTQISASHEVDGELGLVARGDTTTVDAYLTPLLTEYLRGLAEELPESRLSVMQSSGGLAAAARFRGANAILSGPAGGAVALAEIARRHGIAEAIGFDMGGTSTDVCRFGGALEHRHEHEISGVRVRAPMIAIHTVAAGGGSICRAQGLRLQVGPESAGSRPGPLAYGAPEAEALTLTDVDLFLGRLAADRFPFPLETQRAEVQLTALAKTQGLDAQSAAAGFFEIANATMADAIRRVTVARGHDVRDHALVVFGGAGGQHATAIARRLGVRRVLFHPWAGVLSAWGIGIAPLAFDRALDIGAAAPGDPSIEARFAALEAEAEATLAREGDGPITHQRSLDLRYRGSDGNLNVPYHRDPRAQEEAFTAAHTRALGWAREGHPIEACTLRLFSTLADARPTAPPPPPAAPGPLQPLRTQRLWTEPGRWALAPVYARESLGQGARVEGPALILDATSTIALDAGFEATVAEDGTLIADDLGTAPRARGDVRLDPVRLEVYSNLFMSIAEEMGSVLRRTAISTNIKERLDFSCAIFDRGGDLVANAPHIPVHLGAMGETVRAVLAKHPTMRPGEVYVSNDPALGGSHLPDITVVTPVFDAQDSLQFFVACRGHHADVGGITPGSMPPSSTTLEEEGVVLSALRVVSAGRLDEALLQQSFLSGPYPARDFSQNRADLIAQIAANRAGAQRLLALMEAEGPEAVIAYMGHVQENAAAEVRAAIARLPPGRRRFVDALDDGTPVVVEVEIDGARLRVDFSGSGAEHPGNLNAPRAVVVAAVIYVLRTLVGSPIPLNQGCLSPVELYIPPRSLLDPSPGRAVAAGNVETSQRVVDVLLGALGLAAASQGTMNNLTLGDSGFGYYETIAGGAGAGPSFAGADAVHTHMTNTRITDAEVLELRHPLYLRAFSVRRGSGGRGLFRGGDGIVRCLEARVPLVGSILSERRVLAPFGLEGGEPGAPGHNAKNSAPLPGRASFALQPEDRLQISTPGGGGYGRPR
ncbi:MAG: hydantoinase B/oxoprolinase family protein [Myxococcota bacterium]